MFIFLVLVSVQAAVFYKHWRVFIELFCPVRRALQQSRSNKSMDLGGVEHSDFGNIA